MNGLHSCPQRAIFISKFHHLPAEFRSNCIVLRLTASRMGSEIRSAIWWRRGGGGGKYAPLEERWRRRRTSTQSRAWMFFQSTSWTTSIHPSVAFYPFQWWRTCHVIKLHWGFSHYGVYSILNTFGIVLQMHTNFNHVVDDFYPSIVFHPFHGWKTCHVINCSYEFSPSVTWTTLIMVKCYGPHYWACFDTKYIQGNTAGAHYHSSTSWMMPIHQSIHTSLALVKSDVLSSIVNRGSCNMNYANYSSW